LKVAVVVCAQAVFVASASATERHRQRSHRSRIHRRLPLTPVKLPALTPGVSHKHGWLGRVALGNKEYYRREGLKMGLSNREASQRASHIGRGRAIDTSRMRDPTAAAYTFLRTGNSVEAHRAGGWVRRGPNE
jgi:hypothetical protein